MAGAYPDYPGNRLAYESDGTRMIRIPHDGVITEYSPAVMQRLNDEDDSPSSILADFTTGALAFLFPTPTTMSGILVSKDDAVEGALLSVECSGDTSSGMDGNWTQVVANLPELEFDKPIYRTGISTLTFVGAKGLRINVSNTIDIALVHLFGVPTGTPIDRLAIWHPTQDQRVGPAHFDWGNVARGSAADVLFRVKNLSATRTAVNVLVSFDARTDTTPSVPAQHFVSDNGAVFRSSLVIPSLAPGAISGLLTARRVTPSNAVISPAQWTFRLKAVPEEMV